MKDQIYAGLDREVTRQEFLAMLGVITCSILGFGTILKVLMGGHQAVTQSNTPKAAPGGGYGVSSYGR